MNILHQQHWRISINASYVSSIQRLPQYLLVITTSLLVPTETQKCLPFGDVYTQLLAVTVSNKFYFSLIIFTILLLLWGQLCLKYFICFSSSFREFELGCFKRVLCCALGSKFSFVDCLWGRRYMWVLL